MIGMFVLVLVLAFGLLLVAAGRDPRDYDERQRQVHGKAYAVAFWSFACSTILFALVQMLVGAEWLNTLSVLMAGLILSITVFSVVCVAGDAYEKRGVKRFRAAGGVAMLILINGINVLVRGNPLYENGGFTSSGLYLMLAGSYVIVLASYVLKWLHSRRCGNRE